MIRLMKICFCLCGIVFLIMPRLAYAQKQTDYSDSIKVKIPEPLLAEVNITGVSQLPTTKTDDLHCWLEYQDESGNYFKKKIILNAQGASSLSYPKKNLSIDFCEDEWLGESTPDIQIGDWVKQDGFHFKAGWLDTFRGGLSVATAYKFYDDIVADEEPILARAGFTGYSKKVLCHPDGFPCIVSLNGQFQGIYAWQLKKHRKNMGMEKDNPQHVWFQLETYTSSLTTGAVDWNQIEIKNPKEVTDESKGYIEQLALYHSQLINLEKTETDDGMHREIAARFDVTSVIDFILHGLITSNIDGFGKNANFFTYDGEKWFVMPYDLDETFGNSWIATFQFPAEQSYINYDYTLSNAMNCVPFNWVLKYYWDDITSRYAKLRHDGVITTDRIMAHLQDWNGRIGDENYAEEYAFWLGCPSSSTEIINDNWEFVNDWSAYSKTKQYDSLVEYEQGQTCAYNYRIWKAKQNVKGEVPLLQTGYTDTEERVRKWLDKRIALEDEYLGFEASSIEAVSNDEATKTRKVLIDGRLYISTPDGLYNLAGVKCR